MSESKNNEKSLRSEVKEFIYKWMDILNNTDANKIPEEIRIKLTDVLADLEDGLNNSLETKDTSEGKNSNNEFGRSYLKLLDALGKKN